jgi:hypothetical protein
VRPYPNDHRSLPFASVGRRGYWNLCACPVSLACKESGISEEHDKAQRIVEGGLLKDGDEGLGPTKWIEQANRSDPKGAEVLDEIKEEAGYSDP